MTRIIRGPAIGAAVAAAALTTAGPVLADAPTGSYTSVITNVDGSAPLQVGDVDQISLTPCGPDCTNMVVGEGTVRELHPQGSLWVGSTPTGSSVIESTLDPAAMTLTENFRGATISFSLTKDG